MSQNKESSQKYIKEDQVNRMLRLENLFHQRYLTAELLNELVATYVEAIECFDGFYSPMRKYFLQKIQYVVSQPQIDSMLTRNAQNDSMVGALRQTIRMTTDNSKMGKNEEIFSHAILMQAIQAQQKKSRQLHQKNLRAMKQKQKQSNNTVNNLYMKSPDKQSIEKTQQQKAQQRQKKIQMQLNFMKEVSENMKNLQLEVQREDKNFMKKTKRINALMQEQNNTLQARLAMRKRGKGRKKSGDERFVQQVKEVIPTINKEQLKQAQKEIAQAVERMTARLTLRMGTNKGSTGLIVGAGNNDEKYRGRIKVRNQVREEDNEDDQQQQTINKNVSNSNKPQQPQKQNQQKQTNITQSHNEGTGRFTLGGESGGRGRIKRRDTNRLDDDDEQ